MFMDGAIIKALLENGIAVAVLGFLLWYIVKPIVDAHIKAINDIVETMKEERKACQALFQELKGELHSVKEEIITEIKNLKS